MTNRIASGSRVDISYAVETTFGVVATNPYRTARDIAFNLNLQKEVYQSEERRSDRQRGDVRHGYKSVTGTMETNATVEDVAIFMRAINGAANYTGPILPLPFASLIASTDTDRISISSGNFSALSPAFGDVFRITASSEIPGITDRLFTAVSTASQSIQFLPGTVGAAGTYSVNIEKVSQTANTGNTYTSFTFERWLEDLNLYQQFRGVRVNGFTLTIPPNDFARFTFDFVAQDGSTFTSTSVALVKEPVGTSRPLASFEAEIYQGDSFLGFVTSLELAVTNNFASPQVFGRDTSPDILYGRNQEVSGTMNVLFTGVDAYNLFVNEQDTRIIIRLKDTQTMTPNTTFMQFVIERIKYMGGDVDDQVDSGITIAMPFIALKPLA